jgi:hypothetical protein
VLLYRSGKFDAALARLQEIARLSGREPEARDNLLMALCAQRLGRGEEAKKWLDQADRHQKAKEETVPWPDRFAYQTLHREAETLMKGTKR